MEVFGCHRLSGVMQPGAMAGKTAAGKALARIAVFFKSGPLQGCLFCLLKSKAFNHRGAGLILPEGLFQRRILAEQTFNPVSPA